MAAESKIQSKIIKFLKKEEWFTTKIISASPNACPDVYAFRHGKVLFIEVKAPNGRLSPLQAHRHKEILKLTGETVLVPYSFEEFLEKYYKSFS